jgi:AraC-like DNA-binding protein
MQTITPDEIQPVVHVSNYNDVSPGREWGPRTIPDLELLLVIRGRFEYEYAPGRCEKLRAGQVLFIEPDVIHTFRRPFNASRATLTCIHCELVDWGRWSAGDYRLNPSPRLVTETGRDATLGDLFENAARTFAGAGKYQRELVSTLVKAIWLRMAEHWAQQGPDEAEKQQISTRMEQMTEFLRERFRDPITRQDIARRFGLTPEYVNALFKKELGITPAVFLNRHRIRRATVLLKKPGWSVKQVSEAVGFSDQFYFSKIFKRYTSISPSRFYSQPK